VPPALLPPLFLGVPRKEAHGHLAEEVLALVVVVLQLGRDSAARNATWREAAFFDVHEEPFQVRALVLVAVRDSASRGVHEEVGAKPLRQNVGRDVASTERAAPKTVVDRRLQTLFVEDLVAHFLDLVLFF
jgi:hypothetical protein